MKVRVVGEHLLVEMFRMLGAAGRTPEGADETDAAIRAYLDEAEVGVILVGGSHAALLGPAFRKYVQRRDLPVVLPVPDRTDRRGCADEIRAHLQKTLGIRL
ncbi:MAG: hypothetical protein FJ224_04470 [Lentisphaerae bacterium]|nr:hypothetical protein [Lentisphaerota bacterium]